MEKEKVRRYHDWHGPVISLDIAESPWLPADCLERDLNRVDLDPGRPGPGVGRDRRGGLRARAPGRLRSAALAASDPGAEGPRGASRQAGAAAQAAVPRSGLLVRGHHLYGDESSFLQRQRRTSCGIGEPQCPLYPRMCCKTLIETIADP